LTWSILVAILVVESDLVKKIVSKSDPEKICTGKDLASAIAGARLSAEETSAWRHDLRVTRESLKSGHLWPRMIDDFGFEPVSAPVARCCVSVTAKVWEA